MRKTACLALLTALMVAGCSRATPEQETVNDAAEALGGEDRINAVQTLVIEGAGSQGNLGQDMTPEATGQQFTVTAYKRSLDVAGRRVRTEFTREPNFEYFQGRQAQTLVQGLDGQVGYNVSATGTATRISDTAAGDRRMDFYHHPITAVRAALDAGATLSNPRTENGQDLVDIRTADGVTFTLAVDSNTNLPSRVVSKAYNVNLGDVTVETTFSNYQDVNGLQLPASIRTTTDGILMSEVQVSTQQVDAEPGDLAAPAAAASAPPIPATPQVTVATEEIAPGITLLGGQSHHSVLVEFSDHLMLIEAPQNETRTMAVIAKARELHPNKPLTQLVMSHHHFDHSGGLRAAIAEGLTVIADKEAATFVEDVAKRPHTVVQDALARSPKPAQVESVDGERVISDATMTVNLYEVEGNAHADTMLMAYFPRQRVVVEVDLFPGSATAAPYVANLVDNIRKRNLRVDRVVPLHGKPATFAELLKAAQPKATS
jgi:glyoxylase-like metal-dependent hydrolase (beta-lactamase superfamily II)